MYQLQCLFFLEVMVSIKFIIYLIENWEDSSPKIINKILLDGYFTLLITKVGN